MSAQQRAAELAWLAEPGVNEVRMTSNARVLTEGVDVPAVDAVFFADRRSSVADVILIRTREGLDSQVSAAPLRS